MADYAFDGYQIIILGGTSGSYRSFFSLWMWDTETPATLLTAVDVETGPFSLDFNVRPTEHVAIKIDIVLAGCTFGGAKTVTVVGNDCEGDSQTDVIDVALGNGTYSTNLPFSSVNSNGITVQGITVGTITVTQYKQGCISFLSSTNQHYVFKVHYIVYIGNDSTPTYLKSRNETIIFISNNNPIKTNATVEVGRTQDAGGTNSTFQASKWIFPGGEYASTPLLVDGGTLYGYGATFMWYGEDTIWWEDGEAYLYNCTFISDGTFQVMMNNMTTFEYENLTLVNVELDFGRAPTADSKNLILQKASFIQLSYMDGTIPGINNIDASTPVLEVRGNDKIIFILDPIVLITDAKAGAFNECVQRFTCNLHIVNEDGANLTGVEVKCYNDVDSSGSYTLDWTATTNANGKLTSTEYVKHSRWANVDGAPTTTYYPHKFTFTKTGYVGLTLENVQINEPMTPDWRIEMSLTTADLISAVEAAGVNVAQISGDSAAADNLELQYDGSGLLGDTYPLRQDQGAGIAGGLAIHTTMVSVTVIQGSEQDLDNANTSDDGRWTGDDDGSGAEFIFRCTPTDTSNIPVDLHFEGYYDEPGAPFNNTATLEIYDFQNSQWDTILQFSNASSDEIHDIALSHINKAPGSGTIETVGYTIGDVLIKFKQDIQETGNACLLIDHMTVGYVGSLVTMRGTDGANTVAPDNSGIADIKVATDKLADTLEDDAGIHRFTQNALEEAPTGGMSAAEFQAALLAVVGGTVGGTWTLQKILKIQTAWIAGNWRVKSTNSNVQELLDAENGTTVILEQTLTRAPAGGADYRTITMKI